MSSQVVRIVGVGQTPLGRLGKSASVLAVEALRAALRDANMEMRDLDGLVAVPSLASPQFMQAHHLATVSGLVRENKELVLRTIDTGGAGPITALGTAGNFIRNGWAHNVAIVASDTVLSLCGSTFAERSNASVAGSDLAKPCIPHGYDRCAQWYMQHYGLKREQLAMVPVLMSCMAARHPDAMCRAPYTLDAVLRSRQIAPVTNLLECARRADGGVALILSSEAHYARYFARHKLDRSKPVVVSVGEASGSLFPPAIEDITPEFFSCKRAVKLALDTAQLGLKDIEFFGLYDCFPICLLHAIEAVGLCPIGKGGEFVEAAYNEMMKTPGVIDPSRFRINTHGGLQCFGAPWEVPAMYNVTEAIEQIACTAGGRQIWPPPKRAIVYGNGGIFSASSVAVLGNGTY
ncbi:putative 3-ketoacyl-CoA thiolase [Trypanosoma rangeli]|uniref:Putative 3-ketoacyl-CoA thiolase n=1 Tax=Trypanosoma rangeli TaxID=5698 RepID=A0A422NT95_TRYRA|nr:putative 3-ketoacyl-CoA thiolase [Trypanosoma rangeli]RNF08688.1 putative 3-ketoacyl-CoA thiolase [Trypanosoma rangeli]|eukprot:RNF08688.1 putative 3-ketoacyl-CoA thiolase [Trypanosoma rangeli]